MLPIALCWVSIAVYLPEMLAFIFRAMQVLHPLLGPPMLTISAHETEEEMKQQCSFETY